MDCIKRTFVLMCILLTFVMEAKSEKVDSTESLPLPLLIVANKYAEDAFAQLKEKYNYARKDTRLLRYYCRKREVEKMNLYASSYLSSERLDIRKNIEHNYQDSINALLIPYNQISGENITFALKIGRTEKYDSVQMKYLLIQALRLVHEKEDNPNFVMWKEEIGILRNTLTKEQFLRLFILKNSKKATEKLKVIWEKVKSNNVEEDIDSVKECRNALAYLSYEMAVNDIYRHDSGNRRSEIIKMRSRKPLLIRLSEAIDKRTEEDKNLISNQNFDW